jgi:hypothetical protein
LAVGFCRLDGNEQVFLQAAKYFLSLATQLEGGYIQ